MLRSDIFVGTLAKDFKSQKGFKGQLTLPNKVNIYVEVGFEGKVTEHLKNSVGNVVILVGDLRKRPNDSKDQTPILKVTTLLNGGGSVTKYGRLVKDAELKYKGDGTQLTRFTIAVNYGYGDNKETDYIECTIFGNGKDKNPAVTLAEKGAKGREIVVHGKLGLRNGEKNTNIPSITVDSYSLVGPAPGTKNENATGTNQEVPGNDSWDTLSNNQEASQKDPWATLGKSIDIVDGDDDIPF